MDAGYADNKSHLGITVVDYKNSKFDGWDYLILLHHAHNERDGYQAAYEEVLKKAGALGKRIISKPAASNASNLEIGPPYHWLNYAEKNSARVLEQYVSHKIRFPNIVTLLVGELINDHSGITPFLNLFHTLSKYAKTVLISTESNLCTCGAISFQAVLSNWDLSERDKILYMNKAVCDIYDYLNPDIVLVYTDNPIFAYNEHIYGDFGVSMYMLTQAINVDYFVCSIPVSLFNALYINELSKQTADCFGIPIDFASISNTFVDEVVSPNVVHTPICHIDSDKVRSVLRSCDSTNPGISLGNLSSRDNLEECIESIMEILNDRKSGPIVF